MVVFVGTLVVVIVGSVLAWGWIKVLRDGEVLDSKIIISLIILVLALLTGWSGATQKLIELIR
jgi:hypothetical protein